MASVSNSHNDTPSATPVVLGLGALAGFFGGVAYFCENDSVCDSFTFAAGAVGVFPLSYPLLRSLVEIEKWFRNDRS